MTEIRTPRAGGRVRAARLTDLAALGELSRLSQSDGVDARSLGLPVSGPPIGVFSLFRLPLGAFRPHDLDEVAGLILPGGESTTMRQLIERWGLRQPILDLAASGAPIFGTCAGMIVLARLDDGRIVAVRERNVIATAFHPELAGETRFHRLVATMASEHDDPGEGSGRRHHPTRRSRTAS